MAKPKRTKLERAIHAKELSVKKIRQQIAAEQRDTNEWVKKMESRIKLKEFWIEALRKGDIQP